MDLGAATHPGYVRPDNEDGFYASRELAVFAVADGMGGHEHGEVASHLALEAIVQHADAIAGAQPTELPALLHQVIQDANAAIISQADSQDARDRMGTTIVVATIHGDRLYFAHIGDSRLYLQRGDLFTQLTRDHSLVQVMMDRGELTPEQAAIHPLRHQITRVVGGSDYISPEIASQALEPGDVLLLCTDGLSGSVTADAMQAILQAHPTCQQQAEALVQAALDAGGPDNITVVTVAYQKPRPTPEAPEAAPKTLHLHLSLWPTLLILLGFMILCVAGFAAWSYTHPQFFIFKNEKDELGIYQRWIGLPRPPERMPDSLGVTIRETDIKDYLMTKYQYDSQSGCLVKGDRDKAEAILKDLQQQVSARLLDAAKKSIEKGKLDEARQSIKRAVDMKADPRAVAELEKQLIKAEERQADERRVNGASSTWRPQ